MPDAAALTTSAPKLTSLAPQLLVEDLERSVTYYRDCLGFSFEVWGGFYAIGRRDGLELHLRHAPKRETEQETERRCRRENEHLDASAGVDGIEAFYAACVERGALITRELSPTDWGTLDFYLEDPDGHILCFGGRPLPTKPVE